MGGYLHFYCILATSEAKVADGERTASKITLPKLTSDLRTSSYLLLESRTQSERLCLLPCRLLLRERADRGRRLYATRPLTLNGTLAVRQSRVSVLFLPFTSQDCAILRRKMGGNTVPDETNSLYVSSDLRSPY
jgi:hypothetical protein